MEINSITRKETSIAVSELIKSTAQKVRSGVDLSDDAEIKLIVNRYKRTEYFKDLNELMGIVIHKIRNPLAGISTAAEILKVKVEKNEVNDKFFMMIFKEIDRLESTANDLFVTFSSK